MSRRIRSTICSRRAVGEDRRRLVDELAHGRLELGPASTGRRLGAPAVDEPQPQLGGEGAIAWSSAVAMYV